jgi:hypothetical protein
MRFRMFINDGSLSRASIVVNGDIYTIEGHGTHVSEHRRYRKLVWKSSQGLVYSLLCPMNYFGRWTWELRRNDQPLVEASRGSQNLRNFLQFRGPAITWTCAGDILVQRWRRGFNLIDDSRGHRVWVRHKASDVTVAYSRHLLGGDPFAVAGLVLPMFWNPWYS